MCFLVKHSGDKGNLPGEWACCGGGGEFCHPQPLLLGENFSSRHLGRLSGASLRPCRGNSRVHLMPAAVAVTGAPPFTVEFGGSSTLELPAEQGPGLVLPLPLLGGQSRELILPGGGVRRDRDGIRLIDSENFRIGWVAEAVKDERALAAQTQSLYGRMLAAAKGRHLYRIWNYVPHINTLTDGFENYQAFCQGRSLAFEAAVGASFQQVLPAASAVGTDDHFLSLIFICGPEVPRHIENPEQIPAYRYPVEHGPRAPCFSRATVAKIAGRTFTFISGTSAIKGHVTVAPGAMLDQLDCTLDNLRLVSREAGIGEDLGANRMQTRHFKIYLRHASDFAAARKRLEQNLLRPTDRVTYLRSDICRTSLSLEIEATLVG
jgi:chorismate lyase / 3-hydroxybenzoate synthase